MAKFIARDRNTGRVKVDAGTPRILFFNEILIGGAGAAQNGEIYDERFGWGIPRVFVNLRDYPTKNDYEARVFVENNRLKWQFSQANSAAEFRPLAVVLYGVQT